MSLFKGDIIKISPDNLELLGICNICSKTYELRKEQIYNFKNCTMIVSIGKCPNCEKVNKYE